MTVEVADRRTPLFATNANGDFQLAPNRHRAYRRIVQGKAAFASNRKKRPPSALFADSTPPFSRMKAIGSAVRFRLPSM
jgi:hypothetical protein